MAGPFVLPGQNCDLGSVLSLSAQGAGTVSSNVLPNPSGKGIKVVVNISAISGTTPTLTVSIKGWDPASQQTFNLLTSVALNATGVTVLTVYPTMAASANVVAQDHLPPNWQVVATVGGTGPSVTATIAAELLL